MTSPPLLHSLLHTNCCKQVQEDEEIQNDIDFSSIKPKLKARRQERHHVPNTFKAQRDHFRGLREPSSQPKFHPPRCPATDAGA
jgi:hypothetical protein